MIKFKMDVPPISCPPIWLLTLSGLHSPQHRGIPIYHPHQGHGLQAPELGEPLNQVTENRTATFHVPAANDLHSFPFKISSSLYVSRSKCCYSCVHKSLASTWRSQGKKNQKTNLVPKTSAGWGSASLPSPPFHINRRAYKQMKIGRGGWKLQ